MGRQQMAIGKTVSLAVLLALGVAPLAQAQNAKPLFIAADMVTGPGGSGPICVLRSQFMRKEKVAWRIRVQDATGKQLDDKSLKSLVVELSDGQKFPARFGGHPPKEPTDHLWSTSWSIPEGYPTGSFKAGRSGHRSLSRSTASAGARSKTAGPCSTTTTSRAGYRR